MTTASALAFIKRGLKDINFRDKLNRTSDLSELTHVLNLMGFRFSADQFDEAFYLLLFKCSEPEQAEQLNGLKMWWEMLCRHVETGKITQGRKKPKIICEEQ